MCRGIVDSLLTVSRSFCVWVCHVIVDRCDGAGVFFWAGSCVWGRWCVRR